MFPQSQVIKILGQLQRKYKGNMQYKMLYGEVEISLFYPVRITDKNIVTKTFTFDEVLKWYKNPEKYFERSWQNK